jgi:hypothetical protein
MTTPLFLLLVFVPVIFGGVILWLVFRNINRKYSDLFIKLIEAAQKNPNAIAFLFRADNEAEKRAIIANITSIEKINKVEMLKAGKKRSLVRLKTQSKTGEKIYTAELSCDDAGWGISKFEAE